jgi:hypothetical protein
MQTIQGEQRHCTACHRLLPREAFFTHQTAPDGRRSKCKNCYSAIVERWQTEHPEQAREAQQAYRDAHPEYQKAWVRKHPDAARLQHRVSRRVQDAIKRGELARPDTCEACGARGRIEAAHHDYSEPLNVRWLCVPCHRRWDRLQPKAAPLPTPEPVHHAVLLDTDGEPLACLNATRRELFDLDRDAAEQTQGALCWGRVPVDVPCPNPDCGRLDVDPLRHMERIAGGLDRLAGRVA